MRILFTAAMAASLAACSAPDTAPDDVTFDTPVHIFSADTIYTGNPGEPRISALVTDGEGRIVMTLPEGSDANIVAPEVTRTHFDGTMFPGFVDGHAHLAGIGQRELTLDLAGTASLADLIARVEAETDGKPAGELVYGRGWIETDWPEGRMPSAADLDAIAPDNPVLLTRADGHALVANSAAMAAAGISKNTPDPDGGAIEHDSAGAPNGIFIDNAMALVSALIAAPDEAERARALETGADVYASRGWTGLHNMSVNPADAPIMARLDGEDKLPVRLHNAYDETGFDIAAGHMYETDTIRNRAVKIYMDGALGSRGALLSAPYSDRPDMTGLALRERAETLALMRRARDADIQIALHAIGDQANSNALDWMASAFDGADALRAARWRIEHAQILAPADIARFGDTGIVASMQPSHAIGDLKFAPDRLGLDRLAGAYAWQSVLDTGGTVVGGSDAPVEQGSPMIEFYAAVARKPLTGQSGPGWHPEQAVSRDAALTMFTSAPAFASFQEDNLGTLETGKLADMSVFDRDLMTIPATEILDAEPVATIIGGDVVWRAE